MLVIIKDSWRVGNTFFDLTFVNGIHTELDISDLRVSKDLAHFHLTFS